MRFRWNVVGAGWAELSVGEARLVVSFVGSGPEALLEAVTRALLGLAAEVTFEGEPERYRVTFDRVGDEIGIRVTEFETQLWAGAHPIPEVARSVVRAFDRVADEHDDETYESQWRRPFPRRELERLRATWRALPA
jgi:hypothetical protein